MRISRHRTAIVAFALVVIVATIGVFQLQVLTVRACHSANEVRTAFITFLDNTLERSDRANAATLADPSATAQQKAAARVNVKSLIELRDDMHRQLDPTHC